MLKKFWTAWENFLFHSDSTESIHWGRFCIYGLGTLFLWIYRDYQPESFTSHWHPISFYKFFSGPFSVQTLDMIRYVWAAAGAFAAFGIGFAITAPLCFIAAVLLFGHSYNFGVVYHSTHVYVMCTGLMIFTLGNARVGVRLTKMYIVYVLCYCGIQKLFYGHGLDWAFSESFYLRLLINPEQTPFSTWVQSQPLIISQIIAGYALFLIETFAPMAFFGKRISTVCFFLWSSFHAGVSLSFGDHTLFFSSVFCYALFLPWDDIARVLKLPAPKQLLLLPLKIAKRTA